MRNFAFQTPGKIFFISSMILLVFIWQGNLALHAENQGQEQEHEIKKAKIYQDIYPLISETDLYCSFFILEEERLETQIIGAEREWERIQLNKHDVFYINKGRQDGIERGQVYSILEVGPHIKDPVTGESYGLLALSRGQARIVALEDMRASAKIEEACGRISMGHFLIPFQEKASVMGKNLGYDVPPYEGEGLKGTIVYLVRDYNQAGPGHWALINLGEDDGLRVGQQLIVYRRIKEDKPLQIIGNVVVIDTQRKTSTVKILSSRDVLRIGELVQTRSQ